MALTFDDGPSRDFTPVVLRILNHRHVRATFFEEGRHIPGLESIARRIIQSGDEIGNHSLTHPEDPGYRQMVRTNRLIHAATGFRPCLFRPPYGLIDGRVLAGANRAQLRIIEWTVDSGDDRRPGARAIVSRVLSLAQPGSIILMHDGGRRREQTIAALPAIIRHLRERGLRFKTVSALLGDRLIWR